VNESTVSGVYDTGVYNGQTVNGPLPSLGRTGVRPSTQARFLISLRDLGLDDLLKETHDSQ
jgi:hypothetical protein